MSSKEPVRVIISVDVEEEGLFGGHYERFRPTVDNVRQLQRLQALSLDFGFPLTLLCSYHVLINQDSQRILEKLRDQAGAEIGAHLHHWNTPPNPSGNSHEGLPERTHALPVELLRQRLFTLLEAGRKFQGTPLTSFRMGRWDLKAALLPLLVEQGISVDSSICPLRAFHGGADHFLAPCDPYWHRMQNGARILEAPITQTPLSPWLAKSWRLLWKNYPRLLDSFHFFGALSANPLWHSSQVMRHAVRLHIKRGGKLVNLFLHSSELMPGGSPHVPNEDAVKQLLSKLTSFLAFLARNYACEGITMNKLPTLDHLLHWPVMEAESDRDW